MHTLYLSQLIYQGFHVKQVNKYVLKDLFSDLLPDCGLKRPNFELELEKRVELYAESPDDQHFKQLQKISNDWGRFPLRRICAVCLSSRSEINLLCGHGVCVACLRSREMINTTFISVSGLRLVEKCPLCGKQLSDFRVVLPPVTRSPRILSLDGGGGRAVIELETLKAIEKEMDLALPFHLIFDGYWGTSIGK